jgi:hypothetical protein
MFAISSPPWIFRVQSRSERMGENASVAAHSFLYLSRKQACTGFYILVGFFIVCISPTPVTNNMG